jgi:hypothetical protein
MREVETKPRPDPNAASRTRDLENEIIEIK